MKDAAFKLIIFGEGGVGKTSLTRRYLFNTFEIGTKMTIGVDFYLKDLVIEGLRVTLQIWDFAGEDRFRALIPNYVSGASGGVFMYDTTRYSSIVHLDEWMQIVKREISKERKEIPLMMVGGKADLKSDRDVSRDEAIKLAESHEFFGFSECSAKDGTNVEEIFNQITRQMLKVNKFI
jgi:small GTP-binding protein